MNRPEAHATERAFLTAEWRDLVMLNYAVRPELLRPMVPAGTELDSFEGVTYLSVVAFRFVGTRVLGISVPFHRDFEEVNLRFYVRREVAGEMRRGVVFLREIVPRPLIAWVARLWYNEPYRAMPMRHTVERAADGADVTAHYGWRPRSAWEGISLRASGAAEELRAGSQAEFITEHYWGYTRQRDGSTIEYRVTHPRWRVCSAQHATLRADLPSLFDADVATALNGPPESAFWVEGSSVTVMRPSTLPRGATAP